MLRTLKSGSAVAALLAALGGCATTTTQIASIAPEQVTAEQALQRELALRTQWDQQGRLDAVARPILRGALPLCGSAVAPDFGFRFGDIHGIDGTWRDAAARALGLDSDPRVLSVTRGGPAERAGLRAGDILRQVGTHVVTPGRAAVQQLGEHLRGFAPDGASIPIRVERAGGGVSLELHPDPVCAFSTHVVIDGALNAYADGRSIVVTTAMMRFTEDAELAVIVAHELAHNAMGHVEAMRKNQMAGGLLGLLGDIAMASAGVNTQGYYTSQGMQLGAMAYSQDFEREGEYGLGQFDLGARAYFPGARRLVPFLEAAYTGRALQREDGYVGGHRADVSLTGTGLTGGGGLEYYATPALSLGVALALTGGNFTDITVNGSS